MSCPGRTAVVRELVKGDNLAHGVVEGQAEDVDEEIDGVAVEVALGPAPIGFCPFKCA